MKDYHLGEVVERVWSISPFEYTTWYHLSVLLPVLVCGEDVVAGRPVEVDWLSGVAQHRVVNPSLPSWRPESRKPSCSLRSGNGLGVNARLLQNVSVVAASIALA